MEKPKTKKNLTPFLSMVTALLGPEILNDLLQNPEKDSITLISKINEEEKEK